MRKSSVSNKSEIFFTEGNYSSDDNEPEDKKPKFICKRCVDCLCKKGSKAKYCSLKCKKKRKNIFAWSMYLQSAKAAKKKMSE